MMARSGAVAIPLALALFVVASCKDEADARPEWLVSITTDAPVPQFGDRVLVEVLDGSGKLACDGCQRTFGIDAETAWPLTFAIAPDDPKAGNLVRARLFRAVTTGDDGVPRGAAALDALGALPRANGVTPVSLALRMDCFGVAAQPSQKKGCDPAKRRLDDAPTLVDRSLDDSVRPGDWKPGKPVDCPSKVPEGMACIPGGALALGDPRGLSVIGFRALPERLVTLSPFALDVDEVTVGTVRSLVSEGLVLPSAIRPRKDKPGCTYLGDTDPENDAYPINCVDLATARAVCVALGRRLPTEAEWEYAAGSTVRESRYPWGEDGLSLCDRAVVARGRFPAEGEIDLSYACRVPKEGPIRPWGPAPGGSDLDVSEQGVKNLTGNVAEWVEDVLALYDERCWSSPSLLQNPICTEAVDLTRRAVRGGSWDGQSGIAFASARGGAPDRARDISLGFRCAKSF